MFLISDETLKKIGIKTLMILGYFIVTLSTLGFGLLSYVDD
jgi:hypothetical protein